MSIKKRFAVAAAVCAALSLSAAVGGCGYHHPYGPTVVVHHYGYGSPAVVHVYHGGYGYGGYNSTVTHVYHNGYGGTHVVVHHYR